MSSAPAKGLTLILGPANSGKLGRVLRWWEQRQELKPLIVVPTGPDARGLSNEMAQRRHALVGQSPAITFDGLVHRLLGRSPQYVGDFERLLLITYLLHESPPEAPGFSARFPGTAGVTASLLQQLEDSGRTPEEMERVLGRWGSAHALSTILAADIRRLLAAYLALRDRLGLLDRSEAVREAVQTARSWEQPLALYGFTSFTLAQRRLVVALKEVTEVVLVFDYERGRSCSLTTPTELAFWEGLAARVEELSPGELAYVSPAIAYLERHFMEDRPLSGPPPLAEKAGGVRFLLASGRRNEAELAAAEVAELIRRGMRPGDVGVVVRNMEPWGRLLKDVFVSCGIPCQVDERSTLDQTALGYAFLRGLRGVAADDADAVGAYLRSPFSALTLEQAGDVQLDYLRGRSRGVAALAHCAEAGLPGALAALLGSVVSRSDGSYVDLEAAQVLARHMLVNGFAADGGLTDEATDARAFRALQSALSGLAHHRDAGTLPLGILCTGVLLPALAAMSVPAGSSGSTEAVQVLTAHRARARRFQAVVILGLVEGEFPGRADRPALLTAAQRAQLDRIGGGLFSPEADQEEALFVRAVSRAWRVLMLSARDADDGGGYAAQSYYWTHCRALLGAGASQLVKRTLADQVFDLDRAPSLRQYLRTCAAVALAPHPACGSASILPRHWRRKGALAGLVSLSVLNELAQAGCFSPSALETYLRCPFVWFVDRVVGAEDMELRADNRFIGESLHFVLRDTFRQLAASGLLPLRSEYIQRADEMAAENIERLVRSDACPGTEAERRLVEWRLKRMTADLFAMEAAACSPLVPAGTEITVGSTGGVDVGGVAIRGRIDRVDASASGELLVVDYKSGGAPKKNEIGTAGGLQLPLYMLALAAEHPEQTVIGGAYVSPSDKERSGVILTGREDVLGADSRGYRIAGDDEFRQMLEGALELARQAAEGMRSGAIAPLADRDCPSWCRLGPVCRARRGGRRR